MTLRHQTVAQRGDHPLGPAVGARRDRLVERGDLRDPHESHAVGRAAGLAGGPLGTGSWLLPDGEEVSHPRAVGRAGRPDTACSRRPRRPSVGRSPGTALRTMVLMTIPPRSTSSPGPWSLLPAEQVSRVHAAPPIHPGCASSGAVVQSGGMSELHLSAGTVPAGGRHDLVTVDGRSFAISGEAGDMVAATHGLVYDDLRHLSRLRMTVDRRPGRAAGRQHAHPVVRRRRLRAWSRPSTGARRPPDAAGEPCGATSPRSW